MIKLLLLPIIIQPTIQASMNSNIDEIKVNQSINVNSVQSLYRSTTILNHEQETLKRDFLSILRDSIQDVGAYIPNADLITMVNQMDGEIRYITNKYPFDETRQLTYLTDIFYRNNNGLLSNSVMRKLINVISANSKLYVNQNKINGLEETIRNHGYTPELYDYLNTLREHQFEIEQAKDTLSDLQIQATLNDLESFENLHPKDIQDIINKIGYLENHNLGQIDFDEVRAITDSLKIIGGNYQVEVAEKIVLMIFATLLIIIATLLVMIFVRGTRRIKKSSKSIKILLISLSIGMYITGIWMAIMPFI